MIYDFDPRTNRENIDSKSTPKRLLEDILTSKIVNSMSFGTASNYFTQSYGSNHRIIYEGVARLLADVLIGTLDNIEDVEFSQLRAEFVSTRLLYLVFPDENSVPVGENHEQTINFLLQTYEALLKGATKNAINEVLTNIADKKALVTSEVEGFIGNITSSILATSEFNTDGFFQRHRHFAFTDESGLGSTNKPIEFSWGDELHTHDIIDGVIQPYVDKTGKSHTHDVYLGVPKNIIRLQSNLRKVFGITKPAHIKTGTISSVVDEDIPILTKNKEDVFSPILGIDRFTSDGELITQNTIDPSLPYSNQNASHGLIGLSVGSFYQEDMRKAREGVYEPQNYGYVEGKTIRFWRTNIKVADNLIIGNQKLRVIKVSVRSSPSDGIYNPIVVNGTPATTRLVRSLKKGVSDTNLLTEAPIEIINGCMFPIDVGPPFFRASLDNCDALNDGEPIDLVGEIYFCDLVSDNADAKQNDPQLSQGGHTIRLSYIEVEVDSKITNEGLQLVDNNSSPWQTRDEIFNETVEFENRPDPHWNVISSDLYNYAINLPSSIVKDMLKTINGLPVSIYDLTITVENQSIDFNYHTLSLEHTNRVEDANVTNPENHVLRIIDKRQRGRSYNPLANFGDKIILTYPKAKSEIRRFRELNSIEMTLNATRPVRKVSLSGRGSIQNRVVETTSPISYVLNEPEPVEPLTLEQRISTYSAGSSDLLNTQNQNLNTTYTLNNFSLNQSATQDQVYKPATKTLTTSNPKISFYELGFRPSFITSVIDSDNVSYTYILNQDHVLVDNLNAEKTLTVSGLSSNPFSADQDFYRGEELVEGQAFFNRANTSNLANFTESTPERYMQNPLGLASKILDTLPEIETTYTYTNDKITGVSVGAHVIVVEGNTATIDETRSIYSMIDTKTSGVEGELTFYDDVITEYDLDGRDGFLDMYNPHIPKDDWLYPDPILYTLGPIPVPGQGVQVNTIPTFLFFSYFMLMDMNGDNEEDYYISIYRLDNGVKKYQTLTTIIDPNGEDALQLSGNLPESNGSPLAYRFLGDNGFNSLEYNQDSTTVYANASFNHIPNETYYLEAYFEEAPQGASFLSFFSKGSNANVTLSDTVSNLATDAENQNEVIFLTGFGSGVTLTYQVTFTTNPGEIDTFSAVGDPSAGATKETENVGDSVEEGGAVSYATQDTYPRWPLARTTSWKDAFPMVGFAFKSLVDTIPKVQADIEEPIFMSYLPKSIGEDGSESISTTDLNGLSTSLLLDPSLITEDVKKILDDVDFEINYVSVNLGLPPDVLDTITVEDDLEHQLVLLHKNLEPDNVPAITDTISTLNALLVEGIVPAIQGDADANLSSIHITDNVPLTRDPDGGFSTSYSFLPRSVESDVPDIRGEDPDAQLRYRPIDELDESEIDITDDVNIRVASKNVSGNVSVSDDLEALIRYTRNQTDTIPSINDDDSFEAVLRYQPVEIGSVGEEETVDVQEASVTVDKIYTIEVDDPFDDDTIDVTDESLIIDYSPTLILSVQMDEKMADYDFTITIYRIPDGQDLDGPYYKLDYPEIVATGQTSSSNQTPSFDIRNPTWSTTIGNDFKLSSITGDDGIGLLSNTNVYRNAGPNNNHVIDLYVGNDSSNPIMLNETYYMIVTSTGENISNDNFDEVPMNFRVSMQMMFKSPSSFNLGTGSNQDNMGQLKGNLVELWQSSTNTTQFKINNIPGTQAFNVPIAETRVWSFQTTSDYSVKANGVATSLAIFNPDTTTPARLPMTNFADLDDAPIDHTQIFPIMPVPGGHVTMKVGMFLNFTQSNSDMYVYIEQREPTSNTGYNVVSPGVFGDQYDPNLAFQDFPTSSNQVTLKSSLSPFTNIVPPVEFNLKTNRHYHISVSDPDKISLHLEVRSLMPNPDDEYTTYSANNPPPLVNFNTLTNNTNSFLFYIRSDGKIYIK